MTKKLSEPEMYRRDQRGLIIGFGLLGAWLLAMGVLSANNNVAPEPRKGAANLPSALVIR